MSSVRAQDGSSPGPAVAVAVSPPRGPSVCTSCGEANRAEAEACFACGRALHALIRGALLASRYLIRQPVGRGGMGHVYRAYDRLLEEDVAIKVIRAEFMQEPEMASRFRSEIRLARKVSHPNVGRIHEYGEDGPVRYLSMEFVDGLEVKALLRRGPLPHPEGFEAAIQAAEGLAAVHAHGIVHRDLKPSNLMVDQRGRVRLMDFGIAKEADAESGLTGTGQLMGTPEYMSPEQAQRGKVGYTSDVYALGCVIYEMFAGSPPFRADAPWNTLHMHVHEPLPLGNLAKVPLPAALEPVLRRAMAKDPSERFEAAALAGALREARAEAGLPPADLAPVVALAMDAEAQRAETEVTPGTALPMSPPVGQPPADAIVTTTLGTLQRAGETRPGGSPRGRASRRWVVVGVAVVGVLVVAGALWPRAEGEVNSAPRLDIPQRTAAVPAPPPSVPAPMQGVSSPPVPAAVTPREVERPRPRPAQVEPELALPPAQAPDLKSSAPVAAAAAADTGTLSLLVVPEAEVTVDGASLGTLSLRELPLVPGTYVVRILHPDYKPLQRKVTVQAGRTERFVLDLTEKGVRK